MRSGPVTVRPRGAGRPRGTVLGIPLGIVLALLAGLLVPASARTGAVAGPPGAGTAPYRAPVLPLRVLRPFDRTATRYGPGHRGVDLAVAPGGLVRAAAAGRVTFAGRVTGRGVVVVAHPDGVRTEYEPLAPSVAAGDVVPAGAVLGRQDGAHAGCPQRGCLHWGARRGSAYLDPLDLLRPLGVVRLLPWSGAPTS